MAYTALYRVYRPQTFGDVIGQTHVTTTLQNALREGRLSHAYLFNGPRGTGKTSAAKIMAKAVNCQNPQDGEPCNQCPACIAITEGSVTDVLEIDAASNRGVEEIRDIRDKVKFAPSEVKYKVYIIDEVHMLTTEAFNALLKTLEEPPGHVLFILATTEPHKLPATIISRCQRFDFHRISLAEMTQRLQHICDAQQIEAEEQALKLVAKMAEGGMRDALSLLDQAISYSGNQVSASDVLKITGAVSQAYFSTLGRMISEQNVTGVMEELEKIMSQGKDPEQFLQDLLFYFRDMLLYKTAPNLEEIMERTLIDEKFPEVANRFALPVLYEVIEQLNQALTQLKWSTFARVLVEMTLVRLCHLSASSSTVGSISVGQEAMEAGNGAGARAVPNTASGGTQAVSSPDVAPLFERVKMLEEKLTQILQGNLVAGGKAASEEGKQREVRRAMPATGGSKTSMTKVREAVRQVDEGLSQKIRGAWGQILSEVKKVHYKYHAWVVSGQPTVASSDAVIVTFKGSIHCEKTMEPELRGIVERAFLTVTGKPLQLLSITEDEWENVRGEQTHSNPSGSDEPPEDPFIAEAIRVAGERLTHIKE
ncbi:DNA polymerase III subunit gamma/tau [Brevibacillus laterosporus]|uniref:DNA polymerase III subunit gamma/tau n=1 Tax=Brevibacillus laterosporus TaxID=1465 RepID=UPI0024069F32|nr:DNA polymerase III subunit gamma/tau [Brevibacillus laterosporus]MDF9412915.1 DNA polymerase III subunit gamma/tau [Brevibacillus laterosporus]